MSDFSNRDSYLTSKFYGEMMIKYSNLPYFLDHTIFMDQKWEPNM